MYSYTAVLPPSFVIFKELCLSAPPIAAAPTYIFLCFTVYIEVSRFCNQQKTTIESCQEENKKFLEKFFKTHLQDDQGKYRVYN